jgi:hypothetical protein
MVARLERGVFTLARAWGLPAPGAYGGRRQTRLDNAQPGAGTLTQRHIGNIGGISLLRIRCLTGAPIRMFGCDCRRNLPNELTSGVRAEKIVFYNSDKPPGAPGCTLRKYPNAKRDVNWQFDCANDFLNGAISI